MIVFAYCQKPDVNHLVSDYKWAKKRGTLSDIAIIRELDLKRTVNFAVRITSPALADYEQNKVSNMNQLKTLIVSAANKIASDFDKMIDEVVKFNYPHVPANNKTFN